MGFLFIEKRKIFRHESCPAFEEFPPFLIFFFSNIFENTPGLNNINIFLLFWTITLTLTLFNSVLKVMTFFLILLNFLRKKLLFESKSP